MRNTRASRKYAGRSAEKDPFCSAPCAHRFYGVVFTDLTGRNLDEPRARVRD